MSLCSNWYRADTNDEIPMFNKMGGQSHVTFSMCSCFPDINWAKFGEKLTLVDGQGQKWSTGHT